VGQIAALYPGKSSRSCPFGASPSERKIDIRIDFYFVKYDHARTYAWDAGPVESAPGRSCELRLIPPHAGHRADTISGQALPALDLAASRAGRRF